MSYGGSICSHCGCYDDQCNCTYFPDYLMQQRKKKYIRKRKLERATLLLNNVEIDLKEFNDIPSMKDLEKIIRQYKRKLIDITIEESQ